MDKSQWVWMPHTGHFIMGHDCRFHLNTYLPSGYIVSTVGELEYDGLVKEVIAESRGFHSTKKGDARRAEWNEQFGYEEIGFGRKYETMVFKAMKSVHDCCPYIMVFGSELEINGYNDPGEAFRGHMAMCEKWADGPPPDEEAA